MIKIKFTREQYMDNVCTHEEYYEQFVTEKVIEAVKNRFFKEIFASNDNNFNDVGSLPEWELLTHELGLEVLGAIEQANHPDKKHRYIRVPLSDKVCVLKAAAGIIKKTEAQKLQFIKFSTLTNNDHANLPSEEDYCVLREDGLLDSGRMSYDYWDDKDRVQTLEYWKDTYFLCLNGIPVQWRNVLKKE